MPDLQVGDPIEIKKPVWPDGIMWVPATVVYIEANQIGVAYADTTHEVIQRWKGYYRYARRDDSA